ncbi:MAG: tetratricopeptide repeat protein [Halopseudomonas aestusnigri]
MKRAFKIAVVTVSLFLLSFNLSYADDYLEGVEAFEQGDHALALSFWLPLAENGDAKAQYSIGKLYETADLDGGPKYQEAIKWYIKAADQGITAAQNNLGRLFTQGLGVEEDRAKAVTYWQLAAQSKHAMAQYNLGLAYFRGEGVEQNLEQAVFWFHQSANNGVGGAQYALGEVYRLGLSVPKDLMEAKKWYQKSADTGNKRAAVKIKEMDVDIAEATQHAEKLAAETPMTTTEVELISKRSELLIEEEAANSAAQTEGDIATSPEVEVSSSVDRILVEQSDTELRTVPKPVKNPRRYAGIGSLLISKPKSNPRR